MALSKKLGKIVLHKERLEQIDNDEKKNYEKACVIPRKRSYDFEMVTLKNLLYLTTGQALKTKLGQKRPNL